MTIRGQSVTLTREGIVVDGAGKTITFRNAPRARFEMDLEVTRTGERPVRLRRYHHVSRCGLPITGIVTERTVMAVTPTNLIKRWRHDGTVADGER
ncbi:putative phage baseplate protein [Escherichia coli]|nr:putative phage baseplate protein [Escherichia coli]